MSRLLQQPLQGTQIDLAHSQAAGRILHLTFWEGMGDKVHDQSGFGHDGTLTNMNPPIDWVPGEDGYALDFDASNGFVNCGSSAILDDIWSGGGTVAFHVYIRSDGQSNYGNIIAKSDKYVTSGWSIRTLNESGANVDVQLLQDFSTTNGGWRITTTLKEWHWIVVTYDDTSVANDPIFYVDGQSVTVTEDGTPVGSSDGDAALNLIIGAESVDAWVPGDILMSEALLYDRILTAGEALELYQSLRDMWRLAYAPYMKAPVGATVSLAGTSASVSDIPSSDMKRQRGISGSADASSSLADALMKVVVDMAGTSDSVSNVVDAALKRSRQLTGTSATTSLISDAALLKLIQLAGTASGASDIADALMKLERGLTGTSGGSTAIADALIKLVIDYSGTSSIVSSLAASLDVTPSLILHYLFGTLDDKYRISALDDKYIFSELDEKYKLTTN